MDSINYARNSTYVQVISSLQHPGHCLQLILEEYLKGQIDLGYRLTKNSPIPTYNVTQQPSLTIGFYY